MARPRLSACRRPRPRRWRPGRSRARRASSARTPGRPGYRQRVKCWVIWFGRATPRARIARCVAARTTGAHPTRRAVSRPAGRACTTSTARSATSSRPQGLKQGTCGRVRRPTPTSSPVTTCHCATSPPGTLIHAGSCGPVAAPSGTFAGRAPAARQGRPLRLLRMPSGEIRRVDVRCRATVGEVGNAEQANINWGKAGRMRWKGKRPTVRGVVMNPVDHPHGGGEGKTSGGRHPVSPWGKPEAVPASRTSRATSSSSDAGAPARISARSSQRCHAA